MIIPNIWKHNPNVPNHQPDISKVESPAKVFQNLLGQHSSGSSENMGAAGPIILNRCFRISLSNTSAFQWVVSTNRPRETLFVCSVFVCYIYIFHHPASEIHIFITHLDLRLYKNILVDYVVYHVLRYRAKKVVLDHID